MASPPVDLDYPHWDDPVRVGECRFYDPPLPFDAPQPKKNADSAASRSSRGSDSVCSRSGGYPNSHGSKLSCSTAGSQGRNAQRPAPLKHRNVGRHVREKMPWGGSHASGDNKKEKKYHASAESVYEVRMGCRKLDGAAIAHGRAGIPSAALRDKTWTNVYNNPEHGGPHHRPKTFGHLGGVHAAGISTG